MSDEEQSESEFYFPQELQFQENREFTAELRASWYRTGRRKLPNSFFISHEINYLSTSNVRSLRYRYRSVNTARSR